MTLPDFFAALHAAVAANWPGRLPVHVTIELLDGKPIALPIPPPQVAPTQGAEPAQRGGGLSPCIMDILEVLAAAGRPLATTALLAELARAGKEWSRSHVEKHLAEMVRDGTLENPEDARPRGYRLPAAEQE